MAEPTTAITDFLLAAVAIVLAIRTTGAWRFAFLFTGIGAATGGIYHAWPSTGLWKVTVYAVGLATFFLIAAAARACLSPGAQRVLISIAGAQFVIYAIWMATHDEFIYVIADYGSGLLCVAALYALRWSPASKYVLASVAVSAIGAAVQASGLTLHRNFNHNDLYHVIQIGALILLYEGARAVSMRASTASASR